MSSLKKLNSSIKSPPNLSFQYSEVILPQNQPKPSGQYRLDEDEIKKDALEELEIEKEIRETFKLYDLDNSGTIEKEELAKFLYSIGKPFNEKEFKELFDTVDRDHNGTISIDELIFYLKTKVYYIPHTEVDEIIDCFKAFDADNDMKISKKELENILKKFEVNQISQEDIDMFFEVCDKDKNGEVSYAEFVDMWKIR